MSANNRAASKGGKGPKADKPHKLDKTESKASGDKQHAATATADTKSNEYKIKQLIEMTQRSENQVCLALHECDYDMEQAIHMLLDLPDEDEWETTVKKRKNRQQSASKGDQRTDNSTATTVNADDWTDVGASTGSGEKDKLKKVGSAQKFPGSRGWRGRERQENERNLEDGNGGSRERRGRSGGSTRGNGGSRGRGGGRAGGRFPARSRGAPGGGTFNNRPMETWDNSWDASAPITTTTTTAAAGGNAAEESWDEFPGADEWCGTLTETKVFTPSQPTEPAIEAEAGGGSGGGVLEATTTALGATVQQSMDMLAQISAVAQNAPVAMSGTLNAAQSQYFTQLTQQSSSSSSNEMSKYAVPAASPAYASSSPHYGSVQPPATAPDGVAVQLQQHPPARAKVQRAKIPPPSKIPATAVEMPGELNANMGLLDLQFGAMDIISDGSSFDGAVDAKYQNAAAMLDGGSAPATLDLSNPAPTSATMDAYSPSKPIAQSSISSAISQSLANSDSIPQTSEHLASGYGATGAGTQRSSAAASSGPQQAGGGASSSPLDQLSKQADAHSFSPAASFSSYPPKSAAYPSQAYSSSANYSSTQTTNSYVANQGGGGGGSYASSEAAAVATYSSNATNAYQNTYAPNSGYQSNSSSAPFPAISQGATYSAANQTYPQQQQNASQSVYGTSAGLNSTPSNYVGGGGGVGVSNAATQYNNYNSNHKLGGAKDASSGYDSGTTGSSNLSTTTTSAVSSTAMALTSTVPATKSNVTMSKNSNNVVSNIPPSATPVMGQYIMGQMPYFQPPMYSYEDMQMLQQRLPHMTTPFYEMSYQTPATTLREGSYSTLSDGRYARTDSNASPVSSTQTSTQPMLAAQTSGPYFFTPYNPMAPSYQFGAVYTSQLPAGTSAHASNSTAPYPKPTSYGSGYTSGYDTLGQSQDYSKAGYAPNAPAPAKGAPASATSASSSGNDLAGMYGKSHTALGKVNGFHSATPPPFTGALGQSALAPSGTGFGPQMYIPTLPHQQHHSTQLMHQPLHQMEVRHHGRRMDSGNSGGQRVQPNNQQKTGSKQAYPTSYWNQS